MKFTKKDVYWVPCLFGNEENTKNFQKMLGVQPFKVIELEKLREVIKELKNRIYEHDEFYIYFQEIIEDLFGDIIGELENKIN